MYVKTSSIQMMKFVTNKLFSNLWKLYKFFNKRKIWNEDKWKLKSVCNLVENNSAKL